MIAIKSLLYRKGHEPKSLGTVQFPNWNKAKLGGRAINNYAILQLKRVGRFEVDFPGGDRVVYEVVKSV